jgi:hypothetical protein
VPEVLGHDERVVAVDLDVAPRVTGAVDLGRQVGHEPRLARVRDLHEGGAVRAADDRVLALRPAVDPAPGVVADLRLVLRADLRQRQVPEQVHVVARELAGHAVTALGRPAALRGLVGTSGRAEVLHLLVVHVEPVGVQPRVEAAGYRMRARRAGQRQSGQERRKQKNTCLHETASLRARERASRYRPARLPLERAGGLPQ